MKNSPFGSQFIEHSDNFRCELADSVVMRYCTSGPEQSMKIDDRKTNRSIDDDRLIIVNWHRLASANR